MRATSPQASFQMPSLWWSFATKEHIDHCCTKTTWLGTVTAGFGSCSVMAPHFIDCSTIKYYILVSIVLGKSHSVDV